MKWNPIITGVATFLPGVSKYHSRGTAGTDVARYCYAVWLRHLVMGKSHGLDPYPLVVAELGPGDSLGIGIAAMISGCEKYFAFDIVEHANPKRNLKIFDELITLFRSRAHIPGEDEFPNLKPCLEDYRFPSDILDTSKLQQALQRSRIDRIREAIHTPGCTDSPIQYKVPWYDSNIVEKETIDMIYSQAVLEHVDDLVNTYRAMYSWLKPTGHISHQIDFKCHGTAKEWNGHWTYSDTMWKLIRGKRPYLLNREPHSTHIAILKEQGYRVICDKVMESKSVLTRAALAPRFRAISDDDLAISGAFIQAVKEKAEPPQPTVIECSA